MILTPVTLRVVTTAHGSKLYSDMSQSWCHITTDHHCDTCFDSIYCVELSSYTTTIYAAPLVVAKQTYPKRAQTENLLTAGYELIQGLTLPKLL